MSKEAFVFQVAFSVDASPSNLEDGLRLVMENLKSIAFFKNDVVFKVTSVEPTGKAAALLGMVTDSVKFRTLLKAGLIKS